MGFREHSRARVPSGLGEMPVEFTLPHRHQCPREWNGNPVQCSLLGEFHGLRSLAGYSPWGCKQSDMTERLTVFTDTSKILGPQTLLRAAEGFAVFECQELSFLNVSVPYLEMGIKSPLPASLEEQNITVLVEIPCTCRESYKIK